MPSISGRVLVDDIVDALNLRAVPDGCSYTSGSRIDFDDIDVDQDEIDDAASEPEDDYLPVDTQSIREGIRYALAGDWSMAAIMLDRGLCGHDDAQRAVAEEFRWANEQRARVQAVAA